MDTKNEKAEEQSFSSPVLDTQKRCLQDNNADYGSELRAYVADSSAKMWQSARRIAAAKMARQK